MPEKKIEEKKLVPWDPLRVPRVPILGPARGFFSKLNGPGPLGSGGHSHTSYSNGRFWVAQRTLQYDVPLYMMCVINKWWVVCVWMASNHLRLKKSTPWPV